VAGEELVGDDVLADPWADGTPVASDPDA